MVGLARDPEEKVHAVLLQLLEFHQIIDIGIIELVKLTRKKKSLTEVKGLREKLARPSRLSKKCKF